MSKLRPAAVKFLMSRLTPHETMTMSQLASKASNIHKLSFTGLLQPKPNTLSYATPNMWNIVLVLLTYP